jgi:hypothetical protein
LKKRYLTTMFTNKPLSNIATKFRSVLVPNSNVRSRIRIPQYSYSTRLTGTQSIFEVGLTNGRLEYFGEAPLTSEAPEDSYPLMPYLNSNLRFLRVQSPQQPNSKTFLEHFLPQLDDCTSLTSLHLRPAPTDPERQAEIETHNQDFSPILYPLRPEHAQALTHKLPALKTLEVFRPPADFLLSLSRAKPDLKIILEIDEQNPTPSDLLESCPSFRPGGPELSVRLQKKIEALPFNFADANITK